MSERIDHGQEARKHIGWAHDWQGREGDTEATGIATALIAQAEATLHQADATLALVEQQRLANLIAIATQPIASPTGTPVTAAQKALCNMKHGDTESWFEFRPEIATALGIGQE